MNGFPRNKRKQVAALDIIEAVLHGLGQAGSRNDKACVRRMWAQREKIVEKMFGRSDFVRENHKSIYAKAIKAGCDFIDSEFDRLGMRSNDRIWTNMMCAVIEVTYDSLPDRCPSDIRGIWNRMRGTAFTIYSHQDPELESIKDMDEGYRIAWRLITIMVEAMDGKVAA
jgi:hypothetical protein